VTISLSRRTLLHGGYKLSAQLSTWMARTALFVWHLSLDMPDMEGPTSSYVKKLRNTELSEELLDCFTN